MTHRARPPVNWRVSQIAELVALLSANAAPVTPIERAHYDARLAQAAYALNLAIGVLPAPVQRPEPPPVRRPQELLVEPYVGLDQRWHETWQESQRGESRYRALHRACARHLTRSTSTLGGFAVGPRVITFSYPTGVNAPPIEGLS